MIDFIYNVDFSILDFIQENMRNAFFDIFFPFITMLGDSGIIWISLGIVLLFFKKYRKMGIILLCALVFGVLLGEIIIKPLIGRARPFTYFPDMTLLITPPTSVSFPSGHSWSSLAAATVLMLFDKRFGIPALVLAVLIAFSRLYLYVHFPSDVLVGSICGVLTGFLAVFVAKKIMKTCENNLPNLV